MQGASEVARTLIALGLLDTVDIVEGGLELIGARTRTTCYRITRRTGQGYFVKLGSNDPALLLGREGAALHALASLPPSDRPRIPRVILETNSLLITELLTPIVPRSRRSQLAFSITLARRLARRMAQLHAVDSRSIVPALSPHGFGADRIAVADLEHVSAARLELVRLLQHADGLHDRLESAGAAWQHSHVIHGDLKEANLIVVADERGRTDVAFVDWEGAGLGDPAWDVGSVIADALGRWLWSVRPPANGISPASIARSATVPLTWVLPAVHAFTAEYARRSNRGGVDPIRVMRFAAIRLLQTASERAQASTRLTATDVAAVQACLNILSRPEAAARRFVVSDRGTS